MKKTLVAISLALAGYSPLMAFSLGDIGSEITNNARVTFLEQAEIGYGWNLNKDTSGGPMALLGVWQYRFLNLNVGWHDPFGKSEGRQGIPSILGGVHVDEFVRLVAPQYSDYVKNIMPSALRPAWEKLTFSYGPGYDLDRGEWTHIVAINFVFGG